MTFKRVEFVDLGCDAWWEEKDLKDPVSEEQSQSVVLIHCVCPCLSLPGPQSVAHLAAGCTHAFGCAFRSSL